MHVNIFKIYTVCVRIYIYTIHTCSCSTGIFVEIHCMGHNHFLFMIKFIMILRSCSMKIFPTVNISKLSNMHCCELNVNNFKDDFLNI